MLREAAPAKVNLYLHVLGRRPDGYHALDSLAAFAGVGDVLHAEASESLTLELRGPFAAGLAAEADNLVLRAARALAGWAGIAPRARLVLDKRLPVASGIGGGSADAAAALRLLARLWGLDAGEGALRALGAGLGADLPVCVGSRPARMGGVGERLDPAPRLPPCGMVLVNPGVGVSTPAVFRARTGPFSAAPTLPEGWESAAAMASDLARLSNDLEPPALALCPAVADALAWLRARPGCLLARMSGSGATCFGLFADGAAAAAGAPPVVATRPGWWTWGGGLHAA